MCENGWDFEEVSKWLGEFWGCSILGGFDIISSILFILLAFDKMDFENPVNFVSKVMV